MRATLVLEDGQVFHGNAYGAVGQTLGEIVFNTGMTGYQETLTDPSYHRQIVLMTAPHIGNTGVNDEDDESRRIWVAGYVVRDPARRPSNWRSQRNLDEDLERYGIVGISGIDTRQLTRTLRSAGVMRAGIFSGDALAATDELLTRVKDQAPMAGANLADDVSSPQEYTVEPPQGVNAVAHVVAIDLGIKGMTPHLMAQRGIR
ncbi:MAG: carbamoyl-phosphate synthase domain-containing protein, partial [Demequina sp.]